MLAPHASALHGAAAVRQLDLSAELDLDCASVILEGDEHTPLPSDSGATPVAPATTAASAGPQSPAVTVPALWKKLACQDLKQVVHPPMTPPPPNSPCVPGLPTPSSCNCTESWGTATTAPVDTPKSPLPLSHASNCVAFGSMERVFSLYDSGPAVICTASVASPNIRSTPSPVRPTTPSPLCPRISLRTTHASPPGSRSISSPIASPCMDTTLCSTSNAGLQSSSQDVYLNTMRTCCYSEPGGPGTPPLAQLQCHDSIASSDLKAQCLLSERQSVPSHTLAPLNVLWNLSEEKSLQNNMGSEHKDMSFCGW
jgi:hypothetical protein